MLECVTPEEASLLQNRPSLLQRQSTSQGNMGYSEPPDMHGTCACIMTLLVYSCMFIILLKHSTINLSLLHLKIVSETPQTTRYRVPEDQGTGVMASHCMKLAFTLANQITAQLYCAFNSTHYCLCGVHVLREALVII